MQAKGEDVVASLTLLTTMLDFSDTGEIGALVSEQSVAAREAAIGQGGVMPGKELAFTFSSLRANDLMWQYVVNSYLKGKAPPAFDLLYWNADSTNLPGPMFCWYVRNTYLENNLREPGKTIQCGVPVDLSLIDVPAFLYASREDHIVPWKTAYASARASRRRHDVRARRERAYRRRDQSPGEEQAQPLGRRRCRTRCRTLAGNRERACREAGGPSGAPGSRGTRGARSRRAAHWETASTGVSSQPLDATS